MAYSTIKLKPCKCGCGKPSTLTCWGYRYDHLPDDLKAKAGTKKMVQQKKWNARRAVAVKLRADNRKRVEYSEETVKEAWFKARRQEMTGYCSCGCGNPSSKNSEEYFRFSICHILPQRFFKSVQFNPYNWIEMAFWGGCHTNFDNRGEDRWHKLACWDEIVTRFKIIYPLTLQEERKHIPDVLLPYIPLNDIDKC